MGPILQYEKNNPLKTKQFFLITKIKKIIALMKSETGLLYIGIGNTGSSVLGGLLWFILAGFLSVDNYGVVNYYIAISNIFFALGLIGLDATIITFLAKKEQAIHFQATSLAFISALIIASILSIYNWSIGILSATQILFMMTLAEKLGTKKYRQYAFFIIGQRIAQMILSIALYFPLGILGILIGYILGNVIFSFRYILRSITNFTLQFAQIKEKLNFALHSYSSNIVRNFTLYLDKLLIVPLFGYYILGLYQLAFQFFLFLSIIPLSLYSYLLPEESGGVDRKTIKLLGLSLSITAAIAALVGLPVIIEWLFPNFVDSIPIVRIISLAIIPATITAILNATFLGRGRSKIVFIAGIAYIIALVTGLITIGQIFGSIGLAITILVAQIVQATYLVINKKINR